jgi:Mg-chelatase subunit ChlD
MAHDKKDKKEKKAKVQPIFPTEIVAIIDVSGSMESVKDDAIGGFNSFLAEQKKLPDKATFTLVEFNHGTEIKYNGVDISEVEPYTVNTYLPGGMTALYDAIGKGVGEASRRGEKRKVIVAILTDGHENSSHEVTKQQVSDMIAKHTADGWAFVFLAAGFSQFDAEKMGASFGILDKNMSMGVSHDSIGSKQAFSSMNSAATSYRSCGHVKEDWRQKK